MYEVGGACIVFGAIVMIIGAIAGPWYLLITGGVLLLAGVGLIIAEKRSDAADLAEFRAKYPASDD